MGSFIYFLLFIDATVYHNAERQIFHGM